MSGLVDMESVFDYAEEEKDAVDRNVARVPWEPEQTYNPLATPMFLYFLLLVLLNHCSATQISNASASCQVNRTLFNVIWSCLSTVIICAWTAVHPNIPPPSKWRARWNRLKIMFWMIIAPELVLAWAARQFFAAKEIRDVYNESRPGM